ncbi:hypothetical protein L0Y59_02830 [Candidatus Uhrbacteria bacterium]|nr:hypothetical protein [Candidatus Uhrbacteria bacterium]
MMILRNTFLITPAVRFALTVLVAAVALSSVNVQSVAAAGSPSDLPVAVTSAPMTHDTKAEAPMTSAVEAPAQVTPAVVATPAPVSKEKPAKRVWNTVNAPDLETLAEHSDEPAVRTITVPVSAYTSAVEECDSTPFTTADGSQVRDGIVAANFLTFGTRFRIPDHFGDKVFEVHDRMNARYTYKVDIWMLTKAEARAWGVRNVKIEILP